jgi:hypothetical protein
MTSLGRRRLGQCRIFARATLLGDRAAGVKAAAARDEHGIRCLALEDLWSLPVVRIAPRDY